MLKLHSAASLFIFVFLQPIFAESNAPLFDAGPACQYFQDLGKRAQEEVGVPLEQQLPIRKINPAYSDQLKVLACTGPHAIYVDEKKLNEADPSVHEFCMRHEAVHVRYDVYPHQVVTQKAPLTTQVSKDQLLEEIRARLTNDIQHTIFTIRTVRTEHTNKHRERRADLTACDATKCSRCLHTVAEVAHDEDIISSPYKYTSNFLLDDAVRSHIHREEKGYLSKQEIKKIADEQKRLELLCSRHTHEKLVAAQLAAQRLQKVKDVLHAGLWITLPMTAWTIEYLEQHNKEGGISSLIPPSLNTLLSAKK